MKTFIFFCCMLLGVAVMQAQIPTDSLVGYWPFNGNANDESGNGNNGIVHGVSLVSDRFGNVGSAFSFNGYDEYIDVLSITIPENPLIITECAWIKTPEGAGERVILTRRHLDDGQDWPTLMIEYGKGIISLDDRNYRNDITSSIDINDENWHFLVGIKDHGVYTIYIDGILENSRMDQHPVNGSGMNLHIGHHGAWNNYWNGILDDIRIYTRALNESEILSLYHERGWKIQATFDEHLDDQAACKNGTVTFLAIAEGISPISYQWQKEGVDIHGETDSVLTFSNVQLEDAGNYRCIASNSYGTDTSNTAELTIEFAVPTIITGPPGVCEYQVVLYSVPKQEDHIREFVVQGGNKIGATGNTVTVHWGPQGEGSVSLIETSELGCLADTVTMNVSISPLGINDSPSDAKTLTIYPNPASNEITVETTIPGNLSILNLSGQKLSNRQVLETKTVVDISNLPRGVYVVKVVGEKGVQVGKFIKQ